LAASEGCKKRKKGKEGEKGKEKGEGDDSILDTLR
jgi:hypothetical protein